MRSSVIETPNLVVVEQIRRRTSSRKPVFGETAPRVIPEGVQLDASITSVAVWGSWSIAALGVLGSVVLYARYALGHDQLLGASHLFDLNREANVPSWFSSMLIAACALLLAAIACARKAQGHPGSKDWRLLSWIFVFLSLDEIASIHESTIGDLIMRWFRPSGVFTFAWVVAAIPLLALFLLRFLRFLKLLEPRTRAGFILAGTVYVAGAVGMEMAEAAYSSKYGNGAVFHAITVLEEVFEMAGMLLFLQTLLTYVKKSIPSITFKIRA
jgi:hypothetical protein